MTDYQQIVDRVRAFVAGADQTRTDTLAEIAASYAAVCDDTTVRLRRCVDYLHRGLRSEAIHLAESHPNLLEMVAALDIPEIEQWEHICATYDLKAPSRMMIELAQELNEAYAAEQPLEQLLARHRLLALSRAPLRDRLEVLRELAAADPMNQCWTDDQASFERVRVKSLREEAATAIKAHDLPQIDHLCAEMERQPWRIEIPADIREGLTRASSGLHGAEARVQLERMVPQMASAITSSSYSDGKHLFEKWQQIVAKHHPHVPEHLKDEFRALRNWVAEQDRQRELQKTFSDACVDLKAAIDTRMPEEILRLRYRAVKDTGLTIPAELAREYKTAIGRIEKRQRVEQFAMYGIIAVVILAVVAVIGVLIWSHWHPGQR